jgi:hypothetical protein
MLAAVTFIWPESWVARGVSPVAKGIGEPVVEVLVTIPIFYYLVLADIILLISLWTRWLGGYALLHRKLRPEAWLTGDEVDAWAVFCRNCGRKLRWNIDRYCDRCRLPITHQNAAIQVVKAHYFLSGHAFNRVRKRVGTIGRLKEALRTGVRIGPDPISPDDKIIVTPIGVTCIVGTDNVIVTVRPTNYKHLKSVTKERGCIVSIEADVGYAEQQTSHGLKTWGVPEVPLLIVSIFYLKMFSVSVYGPSAEPIGLTIILMSALLLTFMLFLIISGIRNWIIWRSAKRDYANST